MKITHSLKFGAKGEDVALLHKMICAIGVEIHEDEIADRHYGETTRDAVRHVQILLGLEPSGDVTERILRAIYAAQARLRHYLSGHNGTQPSAADYQVTGIVTDTNNLPLASVNVIAGVQTLRTVSEVGRAQTNAHGRYSITYPAPAEGTTPDLQLRVQDGNGRVLYISRTYFHVARRADIPLPLGNPDQVSASEYSSIEQELHSLLGKLRPEELVENEQHQDITYLAGETEMDKARLALFSIAARLSQSTALPPVLFYGLFRQNVPADATVTGLAFTSAGINLDGNAERLLKSVLAASAEARAGAVNSAIAHNIIPASYAERAAQDLAQLGSLVAQAALAENRGLGKTPISIVLSAGRVAADTQQKFITLYAAATGPTRGFWRALTKNPDFTKEEVTALRFSVNVGRFARGHMPLVNQLQTMRQQETIKGTRDLARLSAADWKNILAQSENGTAIGVPPNFTARTDQDALDAFADLLERNFARAHPTTAFAARLAADAESPVAAKTGVVEFLDNNARVSLQRTNIDRYLKDNPKAAGGLDAPTRDALMTSQRMLKLTSRYDVARPLLSNNIHSAQQIYAMGRDRFVAEYKDHPDIGAAEATRIYAKASQTYALALALTLNVNAQAVGVNPAAIAPGPVARQTPIEREPQPTRVPAEGERPPAPPPSSSRPAATVPGRDFPNLQTLFGSADVCACQDCTSVLSPAAYMVDLLYFLNHRISRGRSAKQVLFERRPDIAQIELSCANTNTVLPYIDLVNELLEDAVAPPENATAAARARQTTLTTDELDANPQYVNRNAYALLSSSASVFPWVLPFDLPLSEARTYLGQLGVDRVQLMRAFQRPPDIPSPQVQSIAVEGLGLSAVGADIITGGASVAGNDPWDYWGLAQESNNVQDPVDSGISFTGTWINVLTHVRILLDRARLSYSELTQLLVTNLINRDGGLQLQPEDSCELATMTLAGLTRDRLDGIHRFVRLMRALGWDAFTLDAAITLLQADTPAGLAQLNPTLLRQLYAVKTAARRFRLSPMTAVALFARIETRDLIDLPDPGNKRYSLYQNLFQNLAVSSPVDPIFRLNAAGNEIDAVASNPRLAEHHPTLLAAFEISDAELATAISSFTDGALTLANLSALYRHVLLAKGLSLTFAELASLKAVVERETAGSPDLPGFAAVNPFDAARPELLRVFCDAVEQIRRTGFSIEVLDYLLRHEFDTTAGVGPDNVTTGTLLKSIRDGLIKVAAENAFGADPTGALTRRRLAAVLAKSNADAIMAILDGTSSLNVARQNALVTSLLGDYMDAADARAAVVGGTATRAAGQPRYEYVLDRLLASFRRSQGNSFVVQQLSDGLGLPTATTADLLTSWLRSRNDGTMPVSEDFLALPELPRDPALDAEPITPDEAGFAVYFTEYAALDKVAKVIAGFGFTKEETTWLRTHGIAEGWLDPSKLPLAPTTGAGGRFIAWTRLADAANVKRTLPSDGTPFTALMDLARGGATKSTYFAALEKRTQWSMQSMTILAGDPANNADPGLLSLNYPADYRSERALARLIAAFTQMRRLGISADVRGWIGPSVSATQAEAIKQSVKAKYTNDQWPAIAKPLRDVLRHQQRDALVGYLLAHRPAGVGRWHDPNDVYAKFLIDVEMCACQGTSRIVQANATIQLFVQRCILNLEPEVTVDSEADADWLQWRWMSRYRVWEANRKIFLYAENWIEPGLRTDKSPFFKELENDLLQNAVTNDTAEDAFHSYLEKLDAVARLQVVGVYHQAGSPSVLHVIARKQGQPPAYYYRQWIDSSRWTAWTKIDLDIVSDHVLPVVWNRRLYLFWAIVTRQPDRTQTQPPMALSGDTPPETRVHLEIQLAWSEYKGRKWLPKQTAPQTLVWQGPGEPFHLTLKSSVNEPLLRIDLFHEFFGARRHISQFVLGGVGNVVEAFVFNTDGLPEVGPGTRGIGQLFFSFNKGALPLPTNSTYEAMTIAPSPLALTSISPARPRVTSLTTTYDYYGALSSEVVLSQADRYELLIPHQLLRFDSSLPFFYQDAQRSFFIIPTIYYQNGNYFTTAAPAYVYHPFYKAEYRFEPFYHAFVPLFLRELNRGGVDALFARNLQLNPAAVQGVGAFDFRDYYRPTDNVVRPYPTEGVDFDYDAGYAIYNWELFFHAPFEIGESLSANQQFEAAKHWYEYVFNPASSSDGPAPQRYWITKPFYQMTAADYQAQLLRNLTRLINSHDSTLEHEVAEWRANPFEPHLIARWRPVAYQRAIVMKYIDNLIAWGDQLFSQFTRESVNEATQLYVLAAELLGPKPEIVTPRQHPLVRTYAELEPSLDSFANTVAAAENTLSSVVVNVPVDPHTPRLPLIPPLYFCIPPNAKLLSYWDTVADRLYKIRHCMNIRGVQQQLALFAPPIDPALLVKAAAAGLDLSSILNDTSAALPPYRFRVIVREAVELCEMVASFGAALLVCLEKRDAEGLALLRAGREKKLEEQIREVQQRTVDHAKQQTAVLAKTRQVAAERQNYFAARKDDTMNAWEAASLVATGASAVAQGVAMALHTASGASHMIPDAQFGANGAGGSPHLTAKFGGKNAGHASSGWGKAARVAAALLQTAAQMSQLVGSYQRRREEWEMQSNTVDKEIEQIEAQAVAAEIQADIAVKHRALQELNVQLAADVDDYLHNKFTNKELYEWMISQISATYFQSYQLAYTVAKRAEQCFRRELGSGDSSFIQFGYWDSLKKGLLTADKLLYDLQRLQAAYYSQHERELEITKHVSLLSVDPYALVKLRAEGECIVSLPELLFDLDNPGHYMRRIKTVGVTVPCVAGPYTSVSLTLTLLDNHVRTSTELSPQYARNPGGDDPRFLDDTGGVSAIVISDARDDHGLFEPRLEDERYLPFEYAGAVSTWKLRLNPVYPQFDYGSISDVVLHLRYTARDAGAGMAGAAAALVRGRLNEVALAESRRGLYWLVSLPHDYSKNWYFFLNPAAGQDQVLTLETPPDRFPFFTSGLDIKVSGIDVIGKLGAPGDYTLVITPPGTPAQTVTMRVDPTLNGLHHWDAHPLAPKVALGHTPGRPPYPAWTLKLQRAGGADFRSLTAAEVEDLVIVFRYEVTEVTS
jgi:Tc toxin complex TcA C-terminal TcB-binding domain/Neuraminidase-like domain/Salmonella virulence plasmid 28.1kDa A protein